MKKWIILYIIGSMVGLSHAATWTEWNPPSSPSSALWSVNSNWTTGIAPSGDYKVVFKRSPVVTCILNDTRNVYQVSIADGGSGHLKVASGGNLTTANNEWFAVNAWTSGATGTLEVDGGTVSTVGGEGHMWIGSSVGATGILIIKGGGTVNIGQGATGGAQFGLGWDGGTGRAYIEDGTLNLVQWESSRSIGSATSFIDISYGTVIINGDQTGSINVYKAAGKIKAFGGKGKIVCDYNITNSGKTTIQAIPPIPGDLDNDFDVDIADLTTMANNWLLTGCTNVANLDDVCIVDMRDYTVLASHWKSGTNPDWHVAQTLYPTDDLVVTPYYANNFGIVGDGVTDVTAAIQNAMISLSNIGGGALFLPAGMYKVSGNLVVPTGVTLRGDWQIPNPDGPVTGTVLMAYAGRGQTDDTGQPFIGLSNCAAVKGLTIWYPEQTADNIQSYPPAIRRVDGANHSVENVTFVNAYIGFSNYENHQITASPFLRHIYGTPLMTGIEFDCLADVGRIETVHFCPDYWKNSDLPGAPAANEHAAWLYNNAAGITYGRIDWSYAAYVTIEGYNKGLFLHETRNEDNDGSYPDGQCYNFDLKNCETGVYIEGIAGMGFLFTRFNIDQAQTGFYFASTASGPAMIHTCQIDASVYGVQNIGEEKIQMINCAFENGEVRTDNGYLSVINSDFTSPSGTHVRLNTSVDGATIQGNRFSRTAQIVDLTVNPVLIDHSAILVASLPAYEFRKPAQAYTAAKTDVFVVTEAPYDASTNQSSDATPAFQAALNDAAANGGGIVFVPGGDYRLDGTLTVPTGVELRGVHDLAYSPSARGSVLNTYYGKNQENGTPFIQLQSHAGIRGLTIHHAGQIYDTLDTVNYGMTPYPFMIRGLGSDVYVISIASTIPWQLLDLGTYRCDRHYIDYILGTAMKTGVYVGGGSQDGRIQNCQFNPSAYVFQRSQYASIPDSGDIGGVYNIAWRQAIPYLVGNVNGQVLHQNFVFGGWKGARLVNESGFGPSGYCMGMGIDQCTTSVQVDDVGTGGMDMINSQIVTVDHVNGSYLETNMPSADTFRMFNTRCWGGSEHGLRINTGNVELQLCQIDSWGWVVDTTYTVGVGGHLRSIGSNMTQDVNTLIQLDPAGTFEVISNLIKISSSGMPVSNGTNLTARGNLRID